MNDARLVRLRRYAYWLDSGIAVPGLPWRIGLDPVLGLVPGIGDAVGAALAGWIFVEAVLRRVPAATLARMAVNTLLDTVVGAVPVAGDLFDFAWKSNIRNVVLLQRHAVDPHRAHRADRRFVAAIIVAVIVTSLALIAGGVWIFAVLVRAVLSR